jgi:hypothetical protein
MRRRLTAVPLAVLVVLLAAWPATAADFTVTIGADGAGNCPPIRAQQCTLQAAVNAANQTPGSTIHLPARTSTLNAALPVITANTSIVGEGAATTTIDANGTGRVLSIAAEQIVGLAGVTVATGRTSRIRRLHMAATSWSATARPWSRRAYGSRAAER